MWNAGGSPAQNAYFLTVNLFSSPTTFNGVRAIALDRASMLAGGPANAIGFTLSATDVLLSYSFLAANQRTDSPPAGRNEMVLAINSSANAGDPETQVHARFFHVDFVTPANSTFGMGANHAPNAEITVNTFVNAAVSPGFNTDLVPQQGTTVMLDTVGDRMKVPIVYQNRAGVESLWATHDESPELPERTGRCSLVSVQCYRRRFPRNSYTTARLEQWQRRSIPLDAQHRCRSKWKHCDRLFHVQLIEFPGHSLRRTSCNRSAK